VGGVSDVSEQARRRDDPGLLDQLLALPQVHLIVDGYNVTKEGYGGLSLEVQRARLLTGLAALAARCGAEVTCCFDGAALDALPSLPPVPAQRGVRVRFSEPGVIADDLIRRLVRAEPPGRPVVVVSSDGEVIEGVEAAGARAVHAAALLKRLERG
jgi:predicted RNA-binding protein with PIN domain